MRDYLEYKSNGVHKFWEIVTDDYSLTITEGEVGTPGKSTTKKYKTYGTADDKGQKLLLKMVEKGYRYLENPSRKKGNLPFVDQVILKDAISLLELDDLDKSDTFLEEKQFYFWVDRTKGEALEWPCCFLICNDLEKGDYHLSDVFPLKDFNDEISSQPKFTTIRKYEYVERIKKFKRGKNNFTAIPLSEIAKILSGLSLKKLQEQEERESLSFEYFDPTYHYEILIKLYDNYAVVWACGALFFLFYKERKEVSQRLIEAYKKEYIFLTKEYSDNLVKLVVESLSKKRKREEDIKRKGALLKEYPQLKKLVYDQEKYDPTFAHTSFEFINEDWETPSHLVLTGNEPLIIDGNLKVNGVLYLAKNTNFRKIFSGSQLIITGNVFANDLIIAASYSKLIVLGDVLVNNITQNDYLPHKGIYFGENSKTDILLHAKRHKEDIGTILKYNSEYSLYTNAIIEDKIIDRSEKTYLKFNYDALYSALVSKKNIIDKNASTPVDETPLQIERFLSYMKSWGEHYGDLAGLEKLGIYEDTEVKEGEIYPSSGDWILVDRRCKSGTYGYRHDDGSIVPVKIKNAKKHKVNYREKAEERVPDTLTLAYRYQWISNLFMDWAHRKTVSPFGVFKDSEEVSKKYNDEKPMFTNDPYVALYWLLHFGFSLDSRYNEVASILKENIEVGQLEITKKALLFFEHTDAFYDVEIKKGGEFKNLFLIRRAYLIYITQSYKSSAERLNLWWKSITVYPHLEENLIVRMRWLKNNLLNFNLWSSFDALLRKEQYKIPLLSYIHACNPNTKDKAVHANSLVKELLDYKDLWKESHKRKFAEIYLWDVKDLVTNKKLLKEAAEHYFKGNEISEHYQDIKEVLGEKNEHIKEVIEALKLLEDSFKGFDRFKTPEEEKIEHFVAIDDILGKLKPEILLETVVNVKDKELAKRCFKFLWFNNIPNKKETILQLFTFIEYSAYDITKSPYSGFPNLLTDENDSNLEIAKAMLELGEDQFRNSFVYKKSLETAACFFINVAHLPTIFKYLLGKINESEKWVDPQVRYVIFSQLFSESYDAKINPTLLFSKQQIEEMLEAICALFLREGYNEQALRSIYYCENPLAKDWISSRVDNQEWLQQFEHFKTYYNNLGIELNNALHSSMEFMENS
ncbi:hypothetical protein J8L85_13255 [Maribacter sp. MMG018]|uniref:WGR domain-containing protein n=1 Tax=Maribacter sp. MMG018 TaxID=2822688 RepID=UPI001B387B7B|nr:WGR domain-containing protein [Maribacter sp. MMG018]MBQ4915415.1 hypothetical protein [Maribacter sp. MMG018]